MSTNPKNFGLSLAATDLGLGDILQQQLEDQTDALKKKRASMAPQSALFGAASLSLLGGGQLGQTPGPYGVK